MKLFQKLLLAPAALGLLAPVAANAADVNIAGLSAYSSQDQVTSITQFSDVQPTDWAYQALSNLIERYGCVAGYPNGTYRGNRAMTRYEAAALLNACLDRITEVTDELKRLMKEFERELAILKGRVDGLEARVGELEATQFSTTTKLRGKADFVVGGGTYTGDTSGLTTSSGKYNGQDVVTFNYRLTLNLDTSFTGKDLLYTRLRSGNFNTNFFSGKGYTGNQTMLDVAKETGDILTVDKLWYQFPVGNELQFWVGPLIENYYMLGSTPSIYRPILKQFKLGGYYGVYGASTSPGAGVSWKQAYKGRGKPRFSVSANYTANNGGKGDGGIGTDQSKGKFLAQAGYGSNDWNLTAAYAYIQKGATVGYGTPLGANTTVVGGGNQSVSRGFDSANAVALNAWWQPQNRGWIPAVSAGWGLTAYDSSKTEFGTGEKFQSQDWLVGLSWKDAFVKGNLLGFAIGQPQFETLRSGNTTPQDGNYAMELYYQYAVSDNVTVTPAVFYLSRPFGELTGTNNTYGGTGADSFGALGALVKTTFKF
ncbi:MAG: porin [Synechococcus sp. XM-24]|nr:MAG: porin [Synechococcus sp. XM-24]